MSENSTQSFRKYDGDGAFSWRREPEAEVMSITALASVLLTPFDVLTSTSVKFDLHLSVSFGALGGLFSS